MGSIASATFLPKNAVSHLGFWAKPKKRFFLKPVSKFDAYIKSVQRRHIALGAVDGFNVALVFDCLENELQVSLDFMDPIYKSLNEYLSQSHWIFRSEDKVTLQAIEAPIQPHYVERTKRRNNIDGIGLSFEEFEIARQFVNDCMYQLQDDEAVLFQA